MHDDAAATPTRPVDFTTALPASFGQRRLWFLSRADHNAHLAYQMIGGVRIHGPLDVGALERAVDAVVARHEVLRTAFRHRGDDLYQIVAPHTGFSLGRLDCPDGDSLDCRGRSSLADFAEEEAGRPFDLAAGPLIRATLVTTGPDSYALVLAVHHTICDGWSLAVLLREIAADYRAVSTGRPVQTPPPPIQYADYALWQRDRLAAGDLDDQLAYWRTQLAGIGPLPLPAAAGDGSFAGGHLHLPLGADLTARLAELTRDQGATVHAGLVAAVTAVLSALTGATDIPVGTAVAGRQHVDLEQLVGFFVNTVVIRTDHSGSPTYRQLLGRVRDTCLDAYANQDVPFEKLVEELRPRRSRTTTPLFQVMVTLQNQPAVRLELPGVRLEKLPYLARFAPFPLDFVFRDLPGEGLTCDLGYQTDHFDRPAIEVLAGHFTTLLAAVLAEPDRPLAELAVPGRTAGIPNQRPASATRSGTVVAELLTHSGVREAVLLSREDLPAPVAYVAGTGSGDVLLDQLRSRLPATAVPFAVFVLDELPVTSDGAVDYEALPAPYVAPRTALESTIVDQWRSLLCLTDPIGVHDNFFDLGGHSLLAVRAMAALSAVLGTELPVNLILEHPTIAGLASQLPDVVPDPVPVIKRLPRVRGATAADTAPSS